MYRGTGDPLTLEEVREQTRVLLGRDLAMRNPRWLSRYGNATRLAARYRSGRVLVAGDATHMFFPAGGQSMNLGIQDATNLGWKMAATLQGRAPEGLLDSYDTERGPPAPSSTPPVLSSPCSPRRARSRSRCARSGPPRRPSRGPTAGGPVGSPASTTRCPPTPYPARTRWTARDWPASPWKRPRHPPPTR
ncbi:FAD-dependent monooxygenase [Streptomyces griseofuscus]|uniref:FAD-dependent monooxygenase n=1 Tax=Streptomyces griseofuscus TaxID=146922 RepID=UPI0036FE8EA8